MAKRALLEDVRAFLIAQGELGLAGAPAPKNFLVPRKTIPSAVPDDSVTVSPYQAESRTKTARDAVDDRPTISAYPLGLTEIREELGDCTRCPLHQGRTQIVFGVGDPDARLLFVGEGPGREEDLQGEPFVGRAGQLLTRMITAMGLRRSDVYIANIVKCRPPRNRDPEPSEVDTCGPFLKAQIRSVDPEVIVTLGKYATQTLLNVKTPISHLRGKWTEYEGKPLMPTFHPAYLLRNPAEKRPVWSDLQEVMQRLGLRERE